MRSLITCGSVPSPTSMVTLPPVANADTAETDAIGSCVRTCKNFVRTKGKLNMSERWKPEHGELYYFITTSGNVCPNHFSRYETSSNARLVFNNYFKTEAEAEAAAEKVKALLLSLHYNGTSTANSETLKDTFTECLKNYAEQQADKIWQKARERRLSEQYHNGPEETKLPEWCKVGEWVFADPEKVFGPAGYKKIKATDGLGLTFADGCCIYFSDKIKQARLRPYNAEEMKALIGKVVTKKNGDAFVVTAYTPELDSRKLSAVDIDDMWVTPDDVLKDYNIDNKPAGILEHRENGEWVQ